MPEEGLLRFPPEAIRKDAALQAKLRPRGGGRQGNRHGGGLPTRAAQLLSRRAGRLHALRKEDLEMAGEVEKLTDRIAAQALPR